MSGKGSRMTRLERAQRSETNYEEIITRLQEENATIKEQNECLVLENTQLKTDNTQLKESDESKQLTIHALTTRIDTNISLVVVRNTLKCIADSISFTDSGDKTLFAHLLKTLANVALKQDVIAIFAFLEIDSCILSDTKILAYLCMIIRPSRFNKSADLKKIKSVNKAKLDSATADLKAIVKHLVPTDKTITLSDTERVLVGLTQHHIYARLYKNCQRPAIEFQDASTIGEVCYELDDAIIAQHCDIHGVSKQYVDNIIKELIEGKISYAALTEHQKHIISDLYYSTTILGIKVGMLEREGEITARDNEHISDMTNTATKLLLEDQAWRMFTNQYIWYPIVNGKGFVVDISIDQVLKYSFCYIKLKDSGGGCCPQDVQLLSDVKTLHGAVRKYEQHYMRKKLEKSDKEFEGQMDFIKHKPKVSVLRLPLESDDPEEDEEPQCINVLSFDGKVPALYMKYTSRSGKTIYLPVATSTAVDKDSCDTYRPTIVLDNNAAHNPYKPYTTLVEPFRADAKVMLTSEFNTGEYLTSNRVQETKGSTKTGAPFYAKYSKGEMKAVSEDYIENTGAKGVFCLVRNPVFRSTVNAFDMVIRSNTTGTLVEQAFYTASGEYKDLEKFIQPTANDKVKKKYAANGCSEVISLQNISKSEYRRYMSHVFDVAREYALAMGSDRDIYNGVFADALASEGFKYERVSALVDEIYSRRNRHSYVPDCATNVHVASRWVFSELDPSLAYRMGVELNFGARYTSVKSKSTIAQEKLAERILVNTKAANQLNFYRRLMVAGA